MTAVGYVHGYSDFEARRLNDQADTLAALLHRDSEYSAGSRVLEVGCGIGAQTVHLAQRSPGARIVAVDIAADSLGKARARVAEHAPSADVRFQRADLHDLPFADGAFDHVFVCFVLEHLPNARQVLRGLRRVLCPGGTITVIEGDHGSAFFYPNSAYARMVIDCLVRLQAGAGGDALIGRRLQPLLADAGYQQVVVRPRTVYADQTRPGLVRGFTRNTFLAMIESARADVLKAGLISAEDWERGISDLRRTAGPSGTFLYTFCRAVAVNGPA